MQCAACADITTQTNGLCMEQIIGCCVAQVFGYAVSLAGFCMYNYLDVTRAKPTQESKVALPLYMAIPCTED